MRGEIVEDGNRLIGARVAVALAQHSACAAFMRHFDKGRAARLVLCKASHARQVRDRPTRQRAREFGDVFLCVPAVDAQRVQLEDLAREVFIQAASASSPIGASPLALTKSRVRAD